MISLEQTNVLNTATSSSKHSNIQTLLKELANSNVHVDILALQETWRLPYPEIVKIPGYHFTHKQRSTNRGGGVGFYIRNSISFKLHEDLSHFTDNVFEFELKQKSTKEHTCYPLSIDLPTHLTT